MIETEIDQSDRHLDLLLNDGLELIPEGETGQFLVSSDDRTHIDRYNSRFDNRFDKGNHVVEVSMENAVRWLKEARLEDKEVLLSLTQYKSGVITRSMIFHNNHLVLSTIERQDEMLAEKHTLANLEDNYIEFGVKPWDIGDHNISRRLEHSL